MINDEELIKLALLIKSEEDDELAKLLEAAGFLFVPVLLKYILGAEDRLDDTLQNDYEETWEIVQKLVKRFKNRKPPKAIISAYLNRRSFKSAMADEVVPEFRKAFFGLFDEFNAKWSGPDDFDYRTKSYRDLENWLKRLPKLMDLTTKDAVAKLVQASYEDGKGIKWLERELSNLPEFERKRARTTSITEGLRMYSASEYEAFMQNDAIVGKTWRHTHGINDPRKGHEEADGQTVAKDDFFIINGENCRYPRDPMLSAKESIHCHCFMEPVLIDETK